jgi:hypothetical protein
MENEFKTDNGLVLMDVSTKKHPDKFAIISPSDIVKVKGLGKWYLDRDGYVVCNTPKWAIKDGWPKITRLHRFLGDVMFTRKFVVDHKNLDRLDNRQENLRICEQKFNSMNKSAWKKTKGKYKGTFYIKRNKTWKSQITICNKTFYLGTFKTEEAAAIAFNRKAAEIREEFACLNDIKNWVLKDIEKDRIKKKSLNLKNFKKLTNW